MHILQLGYLQMIPKTIWALSSDSILASGCESVTRGQDIGKPQYLADLFRERGLQLPLG